MKLLVLRVLSFVFLLCFFSETEGLARLPVQYKFSLIDVNSGLSHNLVKCFLKDSRGFLWIGTGEGLNRYDGYSLRTFRYDSRDTTSIPGNGIINLFEDPEGNLWVQTNYGLAIYNPKTEKFYRNQTGFLKKYNLPAPTVENIMKDREGNFWFIQTGAGISKYNPELKRTSSLSHVPNSLSGISSNEVAAIGQNSEGDFWLVHRNGLLEKLDGRSLEVVERNEGIRKKIKKEGLLFNLVVDSDDDLWVYTPTEPNGVFFLDQKTKELSHFNKSSSGVSLNNSLVRGLVEGADGTIWLGTDHGGINLIDKKDFSVQYIRHSDEIEKSLVHNSINALYKDNEGIIWIGTSKKGVNYYHKNLIRFPHFNHQPSLPESLPFNEINAFEEDKKGNLWIGTNGGGLLYFNRASGRYTRYLHDPAKPHSISSDIIVSLLIDREGVLWIGTYLGGLNKFDGERFEHFRHDPKDPASIADDDVWELYEDTSGDLWVGTLKGGLDFYDREAGVFRHFKEGAGEIPLHCNYISALEEDKKGDLWIGSGYGIDVINRKTGKGIYLSHDPKNPTSLAGYHVQDIYNDSQNNIWIGTTEGLSLYNEEDNSFRNFTVEDGLPSNSVIAILEDEGKNLWLSTPNGLVNVLLERREGVLKVSFRIFDEYDGLQGNAFNGNAAFKTSKGELAFGGSNGYNLFRPNDLERNLHKPEIVFTGFQLFNKNVSVGGKVNDRVILSESLLEAEKIVLEHGENVFSIEFAALNYFHPQKNKYKYKLEGFDKDWITVHDNNRRVTYTNLDPGEYEFKVLASNNDGLWTEEGKSLKIAVMAPFWKTNEAYGMYAFLVLIILYLGRRVVLQRERLKFQFEQERREARQLHELDLMKIRFFTNVSHEFRTPLALILAPIERILASSTDPQQQKQFQMIQRNAKRLLSLVNQLLDFRKLEVEGISFYPSEGNIIKFVEESVSSFSDLSEKKNISLSFKTDIPELQAVFDMDKLEKIIFNLLSNAFKFTPENGEIDVEVNCYENDSCSEGLKILELKVKDSGIGIPKDKQEKVFERFFRSDVPSSLVNQGSGIGLSIVREFVKIHGGTISLESEPNVGSCFTVRIPVKPISSTSLQLSSQGKEVQIRTEAGKENSTQDFEGRPVVLLVEDHEDFRFYLKDNLGVYFHIREAKNGKEGLELAQSLLPDIIVSDVMMPELSGMELCKQLKNDARTAHIPFVFLTAHAAEEQKLKGLNFGASDYITKPFNFEILLSKIRNLIAQREVMKKTFEKKISVQTSVLDIISLDDKLIQNAIKVVEENLADPDFSVEMLSKKLGMSRVHLYKKMVALTEKSPVEFIRMIRLQRAAQYLEKSQLTVAEVAYKVGFNNRKYFSKYFKDEYNVLPSAYSGKQAKIKE